MNIINRIRQMIVSFIALLILIWAFFSNALFGKIIILPFLISSFALLGENLFLLLNKRKISHIFQYIFRISFFVYIFGFLGYMIYYAIRYKSYSILIIVILFILFSSYFFKKAFFHKKKNQK